jgi:hypothetical protein
LKVHSALGAEGSYAASPSQTPLTPWRENAPSAPSTAASSAAQQQLAAAQRETVRLGWDLSVLKRDLPELEAAAVQSSRMLEASLSQQEMLIKGRAQGDANLEELRASLRQARAEAATLRQRNEQLEREVATLRQQGTAYGAGAASDARLPNLDEVPRTPLTRSSAARGGMLSPLSPLLVGLDESNANRSRGSAYWRRARMCLRIASIADYWQVQSRDGPGAGARMGTPQPGHRKPPIAPPPPPSGLQASPAPPPPVASGEEDLGNLGPRLQALARKVDHAVTEAVACTLLKISLQDGKDPLPMTGNEEPPLRRTPSQCAALAAVAATEAAAAEVSHVSDEVVPPSERALWTRKLAALKASASSGAAFQEAMVHSPAWVEAVRASNERVIDQNMPPLVAHLRTIVKDGVSASVRSLHAKATSGAGAPDKAAAEAKAASVMSTLGAAVENVQQQFMVGLRASVPPTTASQMSKHLLSKLCETAVSMRCDRLRQLTSADELVGRIWEEVSIVQNFVSSVSKKGPQPWLLSLCLETEKVQLPEELYDFIATHIARHLDPYLDGDVTSPEEERGTSPMYKLLLEAYQAKYGRELPAPPEVVLAMYVSYCIMKSNAYQCFGDLVMGQGRLPQPGPPQERHCVALGKALEIAIEKDFGVAHGKIQGVPISANLIQEIAKEHSSKLFYDHTKNAERLAEANRLGEIGRKEEMKRIFGIEV